MTTSPAKFKLVSRTGSVLVIAPSSHAHGGLSAHNPALKKMLLEKHGRDDFNLMVRSNWMAFKGGLAWLGSNVLEIEPFGGKKFPDCMFAQDMGLSLSGAERDILLCPKRMGAESRKEEGKRFRKLFSQEVHSLDSGRMDFGDVIVVEANDKKILLVGNRDHDGYQRVVGCKHSRRTTKKAVKGLVEIAASAGYGVVMVEHTALHLTTAMTMVGQAEPGGPIVFLHNAMLKDPEATASAIASALGLRVSDVKLLSTELAKGKKAEKAQARWSASVVGHNGKVLVQEGFKLTETLTAMGFEIKEIPFDFIRAIDGGMTCLILELNGHRPTPKKATQKRATKKVGCH